MRKLFCFFIVLVTLIVFIIPGKLKLVEASEKNNPATTDSILIDRKIYDDLMSLAIALETDSKDTVKVKMQLLKILFQNDPEMIKSIDEEWLEYYGSPMSTDFNEENKLKNE